MGTGMEKIQLLITTDNVCDLPKELLGELPVEMISYYVCTKDGKFVDDVEISSEGILRYIESGENMARSEPPSVEEYRAFFREQLTHASQILHISMGKHTSEGYGRAMYASKNMSKVTVFDSGQISSGHGLVVLKAARMAAKMESLDKILKVLPKMAQAVSSDFLVHDTKYMYRAGHISQSMMSVCNRMLMHPVLGLRGSKIKKTKYLFGHWEAVCDKYIKNCFLHPWRIDTEILIITHVNMSDQEIEKIKQKVGSYIHFRQVYVQRTSAAITSNAGEGTFALMFSDKVSEEKESTERREYGSKNVLQNLRHTISSVFLREEFDINHRLMNLILLAAIVGGGLSLLGTLVLGAWQSAVMVAMVLGVVGVSLYLSINKSALAGGLTVCFFANTIVFPIMFFTSGSVYSGMPLWFVLGLIFDWIILKGWICYVMFGMNLAVMVGCVLLADSNPSLCVKMPEGYMIGDIIQSMLFVSCVIGVIFKYHGYIYGKQRKQLEEHEKELMEANSAKDTFLANMSHEIRTPINGIIGMDTMLLNECEDNETLLEYGRNIQSASQTLLSIVNDILDISKIESGKLQIIPVDYELFSVLNDCYVMTQARIKDKDLAFNVKLNPSIPRRLYGDEVRLRQIINNLLSNAVKYTPQGSVTLDLDIDKKSDAVVFLRISVTDTGMGIKKEDVGRLYDSFTRLEEAKNRNIEGTGLGLNLTKNLVEMMDGEISVESIYGQGSTFTVKLPQAIRDRRPIGDFATCLKESMASSQRRVEHFLAPKARILVVDDVPMNLMVMKGLLKYTQMTVDTADSGEKALEMVAAQKYDMIFLDHLMPVVDGVECFRRMKQMPDNPNAATPILVLTANAVIGAREEYLKIGFTDYVSKPVEEAKLYEKLKRYLPQGKIRYQEEKGAAVLTEIQAATKEALVAGRVQRVDRKQHVEAVMSGNVKNAEIQAEILEFPPEQEEKKLNQEQAAGGFIERLRELEELNVDVGMTYCMDDEEFYKEALGVYIQGDKREALGNSLENGDFENYRINVHALKSTSMNIGAEGISAMAKESEFACKDGDFEKVKGMHEDLMGRYGKFLEDLSAIVGE